MSSGGRQVLAYLAPPLAGASVYVIARLMSTARITLACLVVAINVLLAPPGPPRSRMIQLSGPASRRALFLLLLAALASACAEIHHRRGTLHPPAVVYSAHARRAKPPRFHRISGYRDRHRDARHLR